MKPLSLPLLAAVLCGCGRFDVEKYFTTESREVCDVTESFQNYPPMVTIAMERKDIPSVGISGQVISVFCYKQERLVPKWYTPESKP